MRFFLPRFLSSHIIFVSDLYEKSACFPKYMGTAYASVYSTIKSIYASKNIVNPPSIDISNYFAKDSCIWSPYNPHVCNESYRGENGSLECLMNGHDVAFITYKTFLDAKSEHSWNLFINECKCNENTFQTTLDIKNSNRFACFPRRCHLATFVTRIGLARHR